MKVKVLDGLGGDEAYNKSGETIAKDTYEAFKKLSSAFGMYKKKEKLQSFNIPLWWISDVSPYTCVYAQAITSLANIANIKAILVIKYYRTY